MRTRLWLVFLLLAAGPLCAVTYTVTNTADSGAGSLRQAILDSNASVGITDTIAFNVTGAGCAGSPSVCTIKPTSALPNITDPVIIDGYTQPGSSPNTLPVGDNAVLLVEIDGSASGSAEGLLIYTGGTTVRGLVINRFNPTGIYIDATGGGAAGGHVIRGNFIGTDPTGSVAAPNAQYGIFVRSPNNMIGGPDPADRNVIVGGGGSFAGGVRFEGDFGAPVNGCVVQGNYIGTDATGAAALGAGDGIYVGPGSGLIIGGAAAGEGNLISGNSGYGIDMISPGCSGAISGNVFQGNLIGVDATGTAALANANGGLFLGCTSSANQIGGTATGAGNLIADNGSSSGGGQGAGIFLDASAGTGNAIRANLIYSNKGLGIALGNADPIPNDPGDGDTGPNNRQNFPIVSTAVPGSGNTQITGALHSTPNTSFDLDFFSNAACIPFPHEFLEGKVYLGSGVTTTDGNGTGLFDLTVPVQIGAGEHVTATATDPDGNTSEISQRLPFTIFPTSGPPAGATSVSISGTDFAAGAALTIGGIAAADVIVSSSTSMSASTPALPAGSLNDVTVTNTDGSSGTLLKGFVADFLDVPPSYQFYSYVSKLVSNAITVGCGQGDYCPASNVTRAQMAVFLLKAKYGICYTPPPATGTVFLDVPADSFAAAWIEALAALGITGGCGGGNYCPGGSVTRAQMAVFLLKTLLGTSYTPPPCTGIFGDVTCPGTFTNWIEDLYVRLITGGCQTGPLLYCPANPNTRGQMAVFITKTFTLQ